MHRVMANLERRAVKLYGHTNLSVGVSVDRGMANLERRVVQLVWLTRCMANLERRAGQLYSVVATLIVLGNVKTCHVSSTDCCVWLHCSVGDLAPGGAAALLRCLVPCCADISLEQGCLLSV